MPFLLTGTEAFLGNPLCQFKPNGRRYAADIDTVEVEHKNGQFKVSCRVYSQTLEVPNGIQPVRRLGKLGAYTHALGRYWAYETLKARVENFGRTSSSLSPRSWSTKPKISVRCR